VLEDDLDLFAAQNIIPLLNAEVLTDEIAGLLDEVSALITTEVLLELNAEMAGDAKPSAADVAEAWLTEQGLL
jgi:osmoprotectant transport system substrate-binding protein